MRRFLIAVSISTVAIGASSACATKKFVRTSIGDVDDKMDALGRGIEATQERTRRNEKKIAEVDQKVQAADEVAHTASGIASTAQNTANSAVAKVDSIEKASKRLVYDLVLSSDEANFETGHTDLPQEAKSRIKELIGQLKQEPKNVYIEIEGHTDSTGDPAVNIRLGLGRAEAVQRYLHEQYQIPLHKINVISFGSEKPIASNATKEGRAKNRRVVIRILA